MWKRNHARDEGKKFRCCKNLYNLTGIIKAQLKHLGGFWGALGLLLQADSLDPLLGQDFKQDLCVIATAPPCLTCQGEFCTAVYLEMNLLQPVQPIHDPCTMRERERTGLDFLIITIITLGDLIKGRLYL